MMTLVFVIVDQYDSYWSQHCGGRKLLYYFIYGKQTVLCMLNVIRIHK